MDLQSLDGPDLWIGSSHARLNFNLRDTEYEFERIPSFVTVDAFDIQREPPECGLRVRYSLTGDDWEDHDVRDVSEAARMILRFIQRPGAMPPVNWVELLCTNGANPERIMEGELHKVVKKIFAF